MVNAFFAFWGYLPWVSLLIAGLLLVRRSRLRLSARFYRGAWLLLALRCAVPVSISLPRLAPVVQVQVPEGLLQTAVAGRLLSPAVQAAVPVNAPSVGPANMPPLQDVQGVSWLALGAMLWAVGAGVLLLWHLRRNRTKANAGICFQATLIWGRRVQVYETDMLHSPSLVGFLRPVVYLPRHTVLSGEALSLVLHHEHCHAQQGDLLGKLLLTLAQAICWPNPLVWVMCRVAQNDMECACDERLLGSKTVQECQAYGTVILQTLTEGRKGNMLCTSFSGSPKALKERFHAMFEMKKKKRAKSLLVVLAGAMALASALVACAPTPTGVASPVGGSSIEVNAVSTGTKAPAKETATAANSEQLQAEEAVAIFQTPYVLVTPETPITIEKTNTDTTRLVVAVNAVKTVGAPLAGTIEEVRADNTMRIAHGDGIFSEIAGMENITQSVGAAVSQAQAIGTLGSDARLTIRFFHEGFDEEALQPFYAGLEMLAELGMGDTYKKTYVAPISAQAHAEITVFARNGHRGIDIKAPKGEPVLAAQGGTVLEASKHYSWGNYIKIAHDDGVKTLYAHLDTLEVKVGDTVAQSQKIGEVGNTGITSGNLLHFEVHASDGQLVDPVTIIEFP